jgi:hypothetical protein
MVTTAFIIFLLSAAVNRLLVSRSVRSLTVEQKAMLVDILASRRPWFFVGMAAVLAVWAITSANFGHRDWLFVGFLIVLLTLGVPMVIARLRRLSGLGLPHVYVRSAWVGRLPVTVGLVLMLAAMAYKTLTFVPR